MRLARSNRGQSIQIGFVILFGALVILFSTYQAFVVPQQNARVEAKHQDTIDRQMQELRNAVVSIPATRSDTSVTLAPGTTYPSRIIALNPPPPSGTVRTVGTDTPRVNLTLANARATDGEVSDYWDGTDRSFDTGGLVYRPNYNEFENAPVLVYENTLLYERFDSGNLSVTGQRLVDGRRLTLVTLNGSYDRGASDSVSLTVEAVSASGTTVAITNETGENVTLSLASRRNASEWVELLREDGQFTDQGGHVTGVTETRIPGSPFDVVHVELEGGVTYRLRMAKAGLGTGVVEESAAYLTDVRGDGTTIQEGSTTDLVVQVRDRYNNPVTGVGVNASVESGVQNGSVTPENATTDADGEAVFGYEGDAVDGVTSRTFDVNFSVAVEPAATFEPGTAENVTMDVTVENTDGSGTGGGGGGPYGVLWQDPSGQTGVNCPGGPDDTCTVDASQTSTATLTMDTGPSAEDADVDYSMNDSSVGTLSRTSGVTDTNGENETAFTPVSDGVVSVFATSGGSGDTLVLEVVNTVTDLVYNDDAVAVDGPDGDGVTGGVEFTVTNQFGQGLTITEVTVSDPQGPADSITDEVTPNDEAQRTELYVAGDVNEGWVDFNGGTSLPRTVDMDADGLNNDGNPKLSSGGTARIHLYEFQNSGPGSRVDMTGRTFDVTFDYELVDGTTGSKTVTVSPS